MIVFLARRLDKSAFTRKSSCRVSSIGSTNISNSFFDWLTRSTSRSNNKTLWWSRATRKRSNVFRCSNKMIRSAEKFFRSARGKHRSRIIEMQFIRVDRHEIDRRHVCLQHRFSTSRSNFYLTDSIRLSKVSDVFVQAESRRHPDWRPMTSNLFFFNPPVEKIRIGGIHREKRTVDDLNEAFLHIQRNIFDDEDSNSVKSVVSDRKTKKGPIEFLLSRILRREKLKTLPELLTKELDRRLLEIEKESSRDKPDSSTLCFPSSLIVELNADWNQLTEHVNYKYQVRRLRLFVSWLTFLFFDRSSGKPTWRNKVGWNIWPSGNRRRTDHARKRWPNEAIVNQRRMSSDLLGEAALDRPVFSRVDHQSSPIFKFLR